MLNVKVGDEVVTYSAHYSTRSVEIVSRVARKYFYVANKWGDETAYSLETGTGRGERAGYARTLEMEEAINRAKAARETLQAHGVTLEWWSNKLTTEQLEALAEVALTFPLVPERR